MTEPCCPGHEQLVEPRELFEQHGESQARRAQWRAVYDAGSDASPDSAAVLLIDNPHASITALKDEFGPAFKQLNLVRKHGGHPVYGHAFTMPDRDRVEQFEDLIRSGVALCRTDGDALALSRGDEHTKTALAVPQVAIPTLADPGTRTRLHLAGHPMVRRQLGYGRLHRGAAGAGVDAPEQAEVQADDDRDGKPQSRSARLRAVRQSRRVRGRWRYTDSP